MVLCLPLMMVASKEGVELRFGFVLSVVHGLSTVAGIAQVVKCQRDQGFARVHLQKSLCLVIQGLPS